MLAVQVLFGLAGVIFAALLLAGFNPISFVDGPAIRVLSAVTALLPALGAIVLARASAVAAHPRATPRPCRGACRLLVSVGACSFSPRVFAASIRESVVPCGLLLVAVFFPGTFVVTAGAAGAALLPRPVLASVAVWGATFVVGALVCLATPLLILAEAHKYAEDEPALSRTARGFRAAALGAQRWMWPGHENPRDAAWEADPRAWTVRVRLHRCAVGLLVLLGVMMVPRAVLDREPPPGADAVLAGLAGFVLISLILMTALHRILISAVRVTPTKSDHAEAWSTSKDRALSLAKVRSDTRALILIYLVSGVGLVFPATLAVMVIGIGTSTAPAQTLLTTYGAPLLSLVTFGAVSYALSAAKEVAVMRVEVEHRDREPTP